MVVVIEIQQSKQMEEIFAEFNFRLRLFLGDFIFVDLWKTCKICQN